MNIKKILLVLLVCFFTSNVSYAKTTFRVVVYPSKSLTLRSAIEAKCGQGNNRLIGNPRIHPERELDKLFVNAFVVETVKIGYNLHLAEVWVMSLYDDVNPDPAVRNLPTEEESGRGVFIDLLKVPTPIVVSQIPSNTVLDVKSPDITSASVEETFPPDTIVIPSPSMTLPANEVVVSKDQAIVNFEDKLVLEEFSLATPTDVVSVMEEINPRSTSVSSQLSASTYQDRIRHGWNVTLLCISALIVFAIICIRHTRRARYLEMFPIRQIKVFEIPDNIYIPEDAKRFSFYPRDKFPFRGLHPHDIRDQVRKNAA